MQRKHQQPPIILEFDDLSQIEQKKIFADLAGAIMPLATTSPDKQTEYTTALTSGKEKGNDDHCLNVYFTTTGNLGINITKTDEETNTYIGNVNEKAIATMRTFQDENVEHLVKLVLESSHNSTKLNGLDPSTANQRPVVEDSGWRINIDDVQQREAFHNEIRTIISPKLADDQKWMLEETETTGFPGPNYKPLQEALIGSFDELMMDIYAALEKTGIEQARYKNTANYGIIQPDLNTIINKQIKSFGDIATKEEYLAEIEATRKGDRPNGTLNADMIQIPDGDSNPNKQSLQALKHEALTNYSKDLDIDNPRRKFTQWLQDGVGFREITPRSKETIVNIAVVSPETVESGKTASVNVPSLPNMNIVTIPSEASLVEHSALKQFGTADALILVAENPLKRKRSDEQTDPNLIMLATLAVTKEVDPSSMTTPIILDNRSGGFDKTISYLNELYIGGRAIGDLPITIANTDERLDDAITTIRNIKQGSPLTAQNYDADEAKEQKNKPIALAPNDGVPTFFVGGGHHNNTPKDLREAEQLGYFLAEQECRVVTGGGCLEGSMGATHTGFIQYHLDQLTKDVRAFNSLDDDALLAIKGFINHDSGKVNAKKMIKEAPEAINMLADTLLEGRSIIPRNMFHTYSMESLVKLESAIGEPPPGVTHKNCDNLPIRLTGLESPGNKIFEPGSIGTDQELFYAREQHRLGRESIAANNNGVFSDGTNDKDGNIIIHNREGLFDDLLERLGLGGTSPEAIARREKENITVVSTPKERNAALMERITDVKERNFTDKVKQENITDIKAKTR
jgi:predicted Rossmann-fold nucleotide-binding protein